MGWRARAEMVRTVGAVARVHRESDRERAPDPTINVQVHANVASGFAGPRRGEERAPGRDHVWDRCARTSDDGAAGVHQCAGARRAHLERSRA